jgi:hypothetical protein
MNWLTVRHDNANSRFSQLLCGSEQKHEWNRPLGRLKRTWKKNSLLYKTRQSAQAIFSTQNIVRYRELVKTAMTARSPGEILLHNLSNYIGQQN